MIASGKLPSELSSFYVNPSLHTRLTLVYNSLGNLAMIWKRVQGFGLELLMMVNKYHRPLEETAMLRPRDLVLSVIAIAYVELKRRNCQ